MRVKRGALPLYTTKGFAGSAADGGLVLLEDWAGFLDSLRGHQTVLVDYQDNRRFTRSVAEFQIAGIDSFRTLFLSACAKR